MGPTTLKVFIVGCGVGWIFRRPLLQLLLSPIEHLLRLPGYATPPPPPFIHVVVGTGLLTALPFLTLLIWGLIAPRAVLTSRRIVASFVGCSYLMVALGVWWGFTLIPQTMALLTDLSLATSRCEVPTGRLELPTRRL